MAFLLDTNVISETVKRRPEQRVMAWLEARLASDLFLSAITLGELVRGARRLADPTRRRLYERWIEDELEAQFEGRILPFDHAAARLWGEMMGDGDQIGKPRAALDAQIAAVARLHELTLVTRNTSDFEGLGIPLLDPWRTAL